MLLQKSKSSSLWGCELKYLAIRTTMRISSHPPCEDVSWNIYLVQCRHRNRVILLVRMWVEIVIQLGWESSRTRSSSLWGCELKYKKEYNDSKSSRRHPPCEDVSWNMVCSIRFCIISGHPPCEDVSWNGIACSINLDGAVILLMIQHQAFACHETQYAKEFEQLEC